MKRSAAISIALTAILYSGSAYADFCPTPTIYGPGVFSRDGYEWRLTFSPDRKLALWSVSNTFFPATGENVRIFYSRYRNGAWSTPQIAPFSGIHSDVDPAFSPDGKMLYFSSRRPTVADNAARPDFDLWSVTYRNGFWGNPVHLSGTSSPTDELYSSIDRRGRLYFGSNRDQGQFDVWSSQRTRNGGFAPPVKVAGGINTSNYWEFNPEISPDGNVLLFVGLNRPDGYGFGDIYASVRLGGKFSPAINMGRCINSALDDYHPTVLWDQGRLIWMRASVNDSSVPPNFYTFRLPWLAE